MFTVGSIAALASVALLAPTARAQPQLEYSVPAGCPEVQAFRDAVEARSGRDLLAESDGITVHVEIAREGDGLRGSVRVSRASLELGSRELSVGPLACADLIEALGFGVALLLEEEARAPATVAAPAPTVERPCEPEARPRAPAPETASLSVSVAATAGAGVLPGVVTGGAIAVGARIDRFRVSAELRALVGVDGRASSGEALETGLATLAPSACASESIFTTCIALRLGVVWGSAPELVQPRTGLAFFGSVAAHTGLAVEVVPGVLSIDGALELEVPFTPVSFETGGRVLWASTWIAGALRLGATATLP